MTEQVEVEIEIQPYPKNQAASTITNNHYDPNQRPPNFELAKEHLLANRVYKRLDETQKLGRVCLCCNHPINNEQLPICCSIHDLYHLGSSIALFFQFIIFGMIALLIILGIMGIYALNTNFIQNDCDSSKWQSGSVYYNSSQDYVNDCDWSYITIWSLANKRYNDNYKEIQSWLMLISCGVLILFFQVYRKVYRKSIAECDTETVTPADYTIKAINFPKDAKIEEIKDWFIEKSQKMQIESSNRPIAIIEKINMAYDIAEYVQFQKTKTQLLSQKFNETDKQRIEEIDRQLKLVEERIIKEENRVEDQEFTGTVFVTFNLPEVRDRFLSIYKLDGLHRLLVHIGFGHIFESTLKFKRQNILVYPAPEPSNIIWENMNSHFMIRMKYRIITTLVTIIILGICFGILVFISYTKHQLSREDNPGLIQKVMGLLASLLILFINTILTIIIRKISEFEKPITHTNYHLSMAQKLCFALFINTAITLLLAHVALQNSKSSSSNSTFNNFWGETGLVDDLWYVFLGNAFITPLTIIVDPWWFFLLYKRSNLLKQGLKCSLTQKEVHTWFQGQNYDISSRYAAVMKTIWLSAFYATVLPIGIIVSLLGLLSYYWLQKYILLRRCKMPSAMSSNLQVRMASLLEFIPFIYALGSFIFSKITINSVSSDDSQFLPNILGISGMACYIILPTSIFANLCCKDTGEDSCQIPYNDARVKFSSDYGTMNPITHKKELIEWLELHTKLENDEIVRNQLMIMLNEARNKPKINIENCTDSGLNSPHNLKNFIIDSRGIYFDSKLDQTNPIVNLVPKQDQLYLKTSNSEINELIQTNKIQYSITNDTNHYLHNVSALNSGISKMINDHLQDTFKDEDTYNLTQMLSIPTESFESKRNHGINYTRIISNLSQYMNNNVEQNIHSNMIMNSREFDYDCNVNDIELTINSSPEKFYQIQPSVKSPNKIESDIYRLEKVESINL